MAIALIIHGSYTKTHHNWFPWLQEQLESQLGYNAFLPQFPQAEEQNLANWFHVIDEMMPLFDESSILVGHSCGAVFALRILEKLEKPIKAAFIVSGFTSLLGNPELAKYDEVNKTFIEEPFDWKKIKQNVKHLFVYHGDNDPYVPLEQAQEIAKGTGAEFKVVPGAGHFNIQTGYTKFQLLLDDIGSLE